MGEKTPLRPSPSALKAAGRADFRTLAEVLRKARAGESVHGARRRIKRLRSLARLLRNAMGEEAYQAMNGGLKRAADSLAGQRRAEALSAAAERLGRRAAGADHWRHLARIHHAGVSGSAADEPHDALSAAREAVAEARRVFMSYRPRPPHAAGIAEAFAKNYARARKRLKHGFGSGDAESLHTARKFVIHHIHHIELLSGALPGQNKRLAALDRLREALGDLNDLDELEALARGLAAPPGPEAAQVMTKARGRLAARARKSAGPLFRRTRRLFLAHLAGRQRRARRSGEA